MFGAASTPQATGVPTAPGTASAPQATGVPTAPGAASAPQTTGVPTARGTASAPQATGVPTAPGAASAPQTTGVPTARGTASAPQTGGAPVAPGAGSAPQTGNTPAVSGAGGPPVRDTPVPTATSVAPQTGRIRAKVVLTNGSPLGDLDVNLYTVDGFRRGLNPVATRRTDADGIVIFQVAPGDYVVGWSQADLPQGLPMPTEPIPVRVVSGKTEDRVIELNIGLGSLGQGGGLGLEDLLKGLR